jgi:hypothetical protein
MHNEPTESQYINIETGFQCGRSWRYEKPENWLKHEINDLYTEYLSPQPTLIYMETFVMHNKPTELQYINIETGFQCGMSLRYEKPVKLVENMK